ncbi:UPF0061-domain-containing protein [Morchella conica CCBAS932]|uniref:Selenoprotein O n=1 Tax=Morchella conica CCBAS932 TaxID=1392247 RepID=A0A3N4L2C2_9PEZI|nr:UPF0061-domain-containing protein [Morchella conica CCBAS932]
MMCGKVFTGVSLEDIPKSNIFTSKLPPDPKFPTPESSAEAPRRALGPRMVKGAFYTYVRPEPCEQPPELLSISKAAFKTLGINPAEASRPEFVHLMAGNGGFEDKIYPWAQCYGGWQFGQWAGQLGDGRAISLFEVTNPETKERYELQLKGAGKTPYSRFADGRAVLRSSIREFIVSEYLHSIGIPTTRALSLTLLPGVEVARERMEPCAVVSRFAQSWIRIGTFDLPRARGEREMLRQLCDYVRDEVLKLPPHVAEVGKPNRYEVMYREVVKRNAKTVAYWQVYGFMNGVLNTDNTSILGLSLDFGPFGFMDNFDPRYTPNHDDHLLRYSYKNQPTIIWWNLVRFAESTAELFGALDVDDPVFIKSGVQSQPEGDLLVKRAEKIIEDVSESYKKTFLDEYIRLMTIRLGLKESQEKDMDELFTPLLELMEKLELDYHHFYRRLSKLPVRKIVSELSPEYTGLDVFLQEDGSHGGYTPPQARSQITTWLQTYAKRLENEGSEDDARIERMKAVNPAFVPRNWVLDEIIQRVEKKGERDVLNKVMEMVERPYDDWEDDEDGKRWVGDVPMSERQIQCSCSS